MYDFNSLKDAIVEVLALLEGSSLKKRELEPKVWEAMGVDPADLGVNKSGRQRATIAMGNALNQLKQAGLISSAGHGRYTSKVELAVSEAEVEVSETSEVYVSSNPFESMGELLKMVRIPDQKEKPSWYGDEYLRSLAINSMRCFTAWDFTNTLCQACPLRQACAEAQVSKVKALMLKSEVEVEVVEPVSVGDPVREVSPMDHLTFHKITAFEQVTCPASGETLEGGDPALYSPDTGLIYHPCVLVEGGA